MATATMPKRLDTPVRIENQVLADARIAAAFKGMTLGEYISEALKPVVARDIAEGIAARQEPQPKKR